MNRWTEKETDEEKDIKGKKTVTLHYVLILKHLHCMEIIKEEKTLKRTFTLLLKPMLSYDNAAKQH